MAEAEIHAEATTRLQRAARGFLTPDHPLLLHHRRTIVTAGTDTAKLDGKRLADPLEPEYRDGDDAVFHWNKGQWVIVSFAHGLKTTYRLEPQAQGASQHGSVPAGGTAAPTYSPLPEIEVTTKMLDVCDSAQAAITVMPDGPHLYQRKRQLVCISQTPTPLKWLRRAPYTPAIVTATPAYVRALASKAATWRKLDKCTGGLEPVLPPAWLAETLRDLPGTRFRQLEGLVYAPTLLPDGRILNTSGYDKETGLYVQLDRKYPAVPETPTSDDVRNALKLLKEPLQDFCFDPDTYASSRSATLAAILTVLCRYALHGNVPLFAVTSTIRRSGKGKLVDVVSIITTGRHAPRWVQPNDRDGDEERKRMLAIGMSGDPLVLIDNITRPLGSEALDMALTCEGTYKDRIMGKNLESMEVPMYTVFFATGNNITFKADTAPRTTDGLQARQPAGLGQGATPSPGNGSTDPHACLPTER
jgi:hypothetical protein